MKFTKKQLLLFILWGFFITNAMIAEVIGVKLVDLGKDFDPGVFVMSVGILPWPIVFLTTDLLNEFYGKAVVQRLSVITACLIAYAFVLIFSAIYITGFNIRDDAGKVIVGVDDTVFHSIFGQSLWIIVGSITAFLVAQMVDVFVFWFFRERTGSRMIWLRATGSTAVSQLLDTFVVQGIAFWLPGIWTTDFFIKAALTSYAVKLIIAVALTPLIYLGHAMVKKYLGEKEAVAVIKESAEESLHHKVNE
jgi:queuosine precursor transporter